MDHLIYTAASGLADSMTRERVIASNMANANTTGFRAEMLYGTPVTLKGPQNSQTLEARALTEAEVKGADMRAGPLTQTGQPLDLAVEAEAMIAVQAEDGTEAYTRRGDLAVSADGVLQNGDGRPVIGGAGPITVPPNAQLSIAADGSVMALAADAPKGTAPELIDKIKLASPAGSSIAKGLDGLFRVAGGGVLPTDDNARVQSGALEQSNVNTSQVLVDMLEAQRLFDIRTRLISTAKDVDQSGASLMKISAA